MRIRCSQQRLCQIPRSPRRRCAGEHRSTVGNSFENPDYIRCQREVQPDRAAVIDLADKHGVAVEFTGIGGQNQVPQCCLVR